MKAWVPIDGTYDLGAAPRQFPQVQEQRYPLSNCISCTICMEVCPQFNDVTNFVGAATIAQAKLFNMDPAGSVLKEERLRALAGDGGVQECGFAQNCVAGVSEAVAADGGDQRYRARCVRAAGEGPVPAIAGSRQRKSPAPSGAFLLLAE